MKSLLLGAGASKAYKASPTTERMPLARDFFNIFNKLDISSNPWVLIQHLCGYLIDHKKVDPYTYLNSGIDIEELHSEIEMLLNTVDQQTDPVTFALARAAYIQLIFIFATTINEIQNGPVSLIHKRIANCLTDEDTIITFNWDTLMDRALQEVKGWAVDYGYGIEPNLIYKNGWCEPDKNKIPGFQILKLHGSTNWLTGYPLDLSRGLSLGHDLDPSSVFIYEYTNDPYITYSSRYMPGYQPFSYGYYPPNLLGVPGVKAGEGRTFTFAKFNYPWMPKGEGKETGIPSMPLIIPPVKHKQYSLFGDLFSTIWSKAENALTESENIVVIGYSFPQTDIRSKSLFLQAFTKRKSLPVVTIIDPYPENVVQKFIYEFGIPETKIKVYKNFLDENFPIESVLSVT